MRLPARHQPRPLAPSWRAASFKISRDRSSSSTARARISAPIAQLSVRIVSPRALRPFFHGKCDAQSTLKTRPVCTPRMARL
jgi:hypothetical protein